MRNFPQIQFQGRKSGYSHIFDTSCDGIDTGMLHFNCLLYADDVILLSTTEAGLQNCISKFEKYCDDWCIEVNLVKSKVMIFNKAG